jgi:hypothetical protein
LTVSYHGRHPRSPRCRASLPHKQHHPSIAAPAMAVTLTPPHFQRLLLLPIVAWSNHPWLTVKSQVRPFSISSIASQTPHRAFRGRPHRQNSRGLQHNVSPPSLPPWQHRPRQLWHWLRHRSTVLFVANHNHDRSVISSPAERSHSSYAGCIQVSDADTGGLQWSPLDRRATFSRRHATNRSLSLQ